MLIMSELDKSVDLLVVNERMDELQNEEELNDKKLQENKNENKNEGQDESEHHFDHSFESPIFDFEDSPWINDKRRGEMLSPLLLSQSPLFSSKLLSFRMEKREVRYDIHEDSYDLDTSSSHSLSLLSCSPPGSRSSSNLIELYNTSFTIGRQRSSTESYSGRKRSKTASFLNHSSNSLIFEREEIPVRSRASSLLSQHLEEIIDDNIDSDTKNWTASILPKSQRHLHILYQNNVKLLKCHQLLDIIKIVLVEEKEKLNDSDKENEYLDQLMENIEKEIEIRMVENDYSPDFDFPPITKHASIVSNSFDRLAILLKSNINLNESYDSTISLSSSTDSLPIVDNNQYQLGSLIFLVNITNISVDSLHVRLYSPGKSKIIHFLIDSTPGLLFPTYSFFDIIYKNTECNSNNDSSIDNQEVNKTIIRNDISQSKSNDDIKITDNINYYSDDENVDLYYTDTYDDWIPNETRRVMLSEKRKKRTSNGNLDLTKSIEKRISDLNVHSPIKNINIPTSSSLMFLANHESPGSPGRKKYIYKTMISPSKDTLSSRYRI